MNDTSDPLVEIEVPITPGTVLTIDRTQRGHVRLIVGGVELDVPYTDLVITGGQYEPGSVTVMLPIRLLAITIGN